MDELLLSKAQFRSHHENVSYPCIHFFHDTLLLHSRLSRAFRFGARFDGERMHINHETAAKLVLSSLSQLSISVWCIKPINQKWRLLPVTPSNKEKQTHIQHIAWEGEQEQVQAFLFPVLERDGFAAIRWVGCRSGRANLDNSLHHTGPGGLERKAP